jgi:hypothetical protein
MNISHWKHLSAAPKLRAMSVLELQRSSSFFGAFTFAVLSSRHFDREFLLGGRAENQRSRFASVA